MKYMKIVDGVKSHAGGFEYKIGEVMISDVWNPSADNPKDFGGFNISTEDKILRWILRGDTLYDVEIPEDAEVVEVENQNAPHGVFRSNKIILLNPRKLDEDLVMDLYVKSNLPTKTYFQCLTFLSLRGYSKVVNRIVEEKVNPSNVEEAIEVFTTFFDLQEKDYNDVFKDILMKLNAIQKKS